jgi:cytosine/adenosine deaminase-related metal-dependent hydrolase
MPNDASYDEMILQNMFTAEGKLIQQMIISDGRIKSVSTDPPSAAGQKNGIQFFFENALVFPGLINSHDHLDFNLFPRLGNGIYENYLEWGQRHSSKK